MPDNYLTIVWFIVLQYLTFNRTGNQSTNNMMARLARVTFSSQLPPTLIAIALAIEYSIKVWERKCLSLPSSYNNLDSSTIALLRFRLYAFKARCMESA